MLYNVPTQLGKPLDPLSQIDINPLFTLDAERPQTRYPTTWIVARGAVKMSWRSGHAATHTHPGDPRLLVTSSYLAQRGSPCPSTI